MLNLLILGRAMNAQSASLSFRMLFLAFESLSCNAPSYSEIHFGLEDSCAYFSFAAHFCQKLLFSLNMLVQEKEGNLVCCKYVWSEQDLYLFHTDVEFYSNITVKLVSLIASVNVRIVFVACTAPSSYQIDCSGVSWPVSGHRTKSGPPLEAIDLNNPFGFNILVLIRLVRRSVQIRFAKRLFVPWYLFTIEILRLLIL